MKISFPRIDLGNVNAMVFLDLKNAFDIVDHNILLSKMNLYGKQGIARSYLTICKIFDNLQSSKPL